MGVRTASCFWGTLRAFSSTGRRTLYDVLGVSPSSTRQEVKAQFYKLSLLYHPDRAGLGEEDAAGRSWRLEKFIQIKDAYEVLGHDMKRRAYDRQHGIWAVNQATPVVNRPVWDPYPGYRHTSSRFVYARQPAANVGEAETRGPTPGDRPPKWAEYSEADLERINAARWSSAREQRQAATIKRNRLVAIMFIITCYYFIQYYEHGEGVP